MRTIIMNVFFRVEVYEETNFFDFVWEIWISFHKSEQIVE